MEGAAAYRDRFELIHRHRAERPNALWQADHTLLDDHSRVIAGYTIFVGAPSAIQTALVLRQAIWRKDTPSWLVCGVPDALYIDHGSDFTSEHLEQVAAELRIELIFSSVGRPQGRGKIERFFGTLNTELLPELPGALIRGKPVTPPRLSISELDAAIGTFVVDVYNARVHSEIGQSPHEAWRGDGWLPRLPESLEVLDLLLVMVIKSRMVHRDGIRFQGLRYTDPTLAAFVGQSVAIRYDPRDIAEIRVYHQNRFLCRAVSADNAHRTISLKDIQQARIARRKALRSEIVTRTRKVTEFLPDPPSPVPVPESTQETSSQSSPRLVLYEEDKTS